MMPKSTLSPIVHKHIMMYIIMHTYIHRYTLSGLGEETHITEDTDLHVLQRSLT